MIKKSLGCIISTVLAHGGHCSTWNLTSCWVMAEIAFARHPNTGADLEESCRRSRKREYSNKHIFHYYIDMCIRIQTQHQENIEGTTVTRHSSSSFHPGAACLTGRRHCNPGGVAGRGGNFAGDDGAPMNVFFARFGGKGGKEGMKWFKNCWPTLNWI